MSKTVLGIHLTDRVDEAARVQAVLTEFGCCIKTRIGLHDVSDHDCAPSGLILLEIHPHNAHCSALEQSLLAIPGVEVKKMEF